MVVSHGLLFVQWYCWFCMLRCFGWNHWARLWIDTRVRGSWFNIVLSLAIPWSVLMPPYRCLTLGTSPESVSTWSGCFLLRPARPRKLDLSTTDARHLFHRIDLNSSNRVPWKWGKSFEKKQLVTVMDTRSRSFYSLQFYYSKVLRRKSPLFCFALLIPKAEFRDWLVFAIWALRCLYLSSKNLCEESWCFPTGTSYPWIWRTGF